MIQPIKTYTGRATINIFHADCMDILRDTKDNYYDLAIVDPPYGIGISSNPVRQKHTKKKWDNSVPDETYFKELMRCSKNQIIFGGNYFNLPPSKGFVIWDKVQPENFSLAMCEYAWISFQKPAKIWRKSVLAERNKIHPTQKPVALYKWLLNLYSLPNETILDTHGGSMSSAIACWDTEHNLDIIECDKDYCLNACNRIDNHLKQEFIL